MNDSDSFIDIQNSDTDDSSIPQDTNVSIIQVSDTKGFESLFDPNIPTHLGVEDDAKPYDHLLLPGLDLSIFTNFGTKVINSCEAIIQSSEGYINDILGELDSDISENTSPEQMPLPEQDTLTLVEIKEIRFQDLCKNEHKDERTYKQLKILCRNNTGELLRLFNNDLVIYAKVGTKIIGMCAVGMKSPNDHFDNEIYDDIPYLYNFICDKSKRKRQSLSLMNYIKDWAIKRNDKYINLDVLSDNKHAQNFFERNGFINCGIYRTTKLDYIMYTYYV
jgi:ribosomal protein S18 acetylase RimI-like enzyme